MSAFIGIARITGVALAAATAKTIIQLVAPSNHRIKIKEISASLRGVVNTDTPGLIELLIQSTAGTMSALTLVKEDTSLSETLQSTAQHTATVEPTAGVVQRSWSVHPQTGIMYPLPLLDEIILGGGLRIGLRATFAQIQTIDAYIRYEE